MRLPSVGKRKCAVDYNADGAVIEQASDFLQLRPARADLGCRDCDAQLLGLLCAGKSQGEDREQGAAALERFQETAGLRTADSVDDEIASRTTSSGVVFV